MRLIHIASEFSGGLPGIRSFAWQAGGSINISEAVGWCGNAGCACAVMIHRVLNSATPIR
jgi:hypothetical protein